MSIIITIIIFGIIVVIHEFGHFIASVKSGVRVDEFSVGMGPKLFGKQKGDTLYSVRAFPLGGFCRMDDESFNNVSAVKRIIIILAGAFMNFVLAFVILAALMMFNGYSEPVIKNVTQGMPAEAQDIQPGDRIIKFNDTRIRIYDDLSYELYQAGNKPVELTIKRGNQILNKTITPVLYDGRYVMGVGLQAKSPLFKDKIEGFEKASFMGCLYNGFWNMIFMIRATFIGLIRMFTFNISLNEVAGPIGLTVAIDEVYKESMRQSIFYTLQNMANIAALLSANIGMMNLLPIPALDGGRFIFILIELIRRKPIPQEKEGMAHFVGFVVLMAFAVFIAFHDILKIL